MPRTPPPSAPPTTDPLPPNVDVHPVVVGHLPLIRGVIDRLGIREVIDSILPQDPRADVSDADCVTVMIANILHGRVALYEIGEWLSGVDTGVLLWDGCAAQFFNDDRLGDTLDRLFRAGTDSVFGAVVERFLKTRPPDEEYLVPTDTTTLRLQGAYVDRYDDRELAERAPRPARGHSKDFRPDLLQLVYGMSVHGPTGVPLAASMLNGNTSDHIANRIQIDKLAQLLPPAHDVTLVADCKFVDTTTLGWARRSGFNYVSLLPRTFALRTALVEEVRTSGQALVEVGRYRGRTFADAEKVYTAQAFERAIAVTNDETGEVEEVSHGLVVVWSSSGQVRFDAALPTMLAAEQKALLRAAKKIAGHDYRCEADARAARDLVAQQAPLHVVDARVVHTTERVKRKGPGRPRNDEHAEVQENWKVVVVGLAPDEAAVARARFHAAHFVLVSSRVGKDAWSAQRVFESYRAQQTIEGHTGFRWLKDAAAVAPVFLKLPHRIAALGMVFLLALMVRNWIEGTLRAELARRDESLPDMNDRMTRRPSAEAAMRLFALVQGVHILVDNVVRQRTIHRLDHHAVRVVELLGFPLDLFWEPRPKLGGGRRRTNEM